VKAEVTVDLEVDRSMVAAIARDIVTILYGLGPLGSRVGMNNKELRVTKITPANIR